MRRLGCQAGRFAALIDCEGAALYAFDRRIDGGNFSLARCKFVLTRRQTIILLIKSVRTHVQFRLTVRQLQFLLSTPLRGIRVMSALRQRLA